jgi:hypothetical protein
MNKLDKAALRYSGLMGHPYAVVIDWDGRKASAEVNTADEAEKYCQQYEAKNPTIYHQVKRGVWVKIGRIILIN